MIGPDTTTVGDPRGRPRVLCVRVLVPASGMALPAPRGRGSTQPARAPRRSRLLARSNPGPVTAHLIVPPNRRVRTNLERRVGASSRVLVPGSRPADTRFAHPGRYHPMPFRCEAGMPSVATGYGGRVSRVRRAPESGTRHGARPHDCGRPLRLTDLVHAGPPCRRTWHRVASPHEKRPAAPTGGGPLREARGPHPVTGFRAAAYVGPGASRQARSCAAHFTGAPTLKVNSTGGKPSVK
jgi:hypothetical protein